MSFTEDMNTVVKPPASLIKFDVDDVQKSAAVFTWQTDRMFRAQYNEAALGPVDVDLKTLTTHPNFKTALGELVFPFDEQCIEFNANATWNYSDPVWWIDITFQSTMDESVTPVPADFEMRQGANPFTPDNVFWLSQATLRIHKDVIGLPSAPYDIELLGATDNLRCLAGSVIPAFSLNGIPPG